MEHTLPEGAHHGQRAGWHSISSLLLWDEFPGAGKDRKSLPNINQTITHAGRDSGTAPENGRSDTPQRGPTGTRWRSMVVFAR